MTFLSIHLHLIISPRLFSSWISEHLKQVQRRQVVKNFLWLFLALCGTSIQITAWIYHSPSLHLAELVFLDKDPRFFVVVATQPRGKGHTSYLTHFILPSCCSSSCISCSCFAKYNLCNPVIQSVLVISKAVLNMKEYWTGFLERPLPKQEKTPSCVVKVALNWSSSVSCYSKFPSLQGSICLSPCCHGFVIPISEIAGPCLFSSILLHGNDNLNQERWANTITKMTGETPDIRSDQRKPIEDGQNHRYHRYHGSHRFHGSPR